MMRGFAGSIRRIAAAGFLLGVAACGGCSGEEGPPMYQLTGTVTYDGRPIPVGDIRFEPLEGIVNKQTITVALIQEGKYTTQVTGGPHRVAVRDFTGAADDSTERPLFRREYYEQIDLPPIESVTQVETYDVDVPREHR